MFHVNVAFSSPLSPCYMAKSGTYQHKCYSPSGNVLTTLVLRLISRLSRSIVLLVLQCSYGNSYKLGSLLYHPRVSWLLLSNKAFRVSSTLERTKSFDSVLINSSKICHRKCWKQRMFLWVILRVIKVNWLLITREMDTLKRQ